MDPTTSVFQVFLALLLSALIYVPVPGDAPVSPSVLVRSDHQYRPPILGSILHFMCLFLVSCQLLRTGIHLHLLSVILPILQVPAQLLLPGSEGLGVHSGQSTNTPSPASGRCVPPTEGSPLGLAMPFMGCGVSGLLGGWWWVQGPSPLALAWTSSAVPSHPSSGNAVFQLLELQGCPYYRYF